MKKIIIAIDSFKGCMTAQQAVESVRRGLPDDVAAVCLPMADGGEGTQEVLRHYTSGTLVTCAAVDPLLRPITASYTISADGSTAIMDMASAAGLTLLSDNERHPLLTSTYGLGLMMLDAVNRGCHHLLVGIGGSATCDCGMGMMSALGVRFTDSEGGVLMGCGSDMTVVTAMDMSAMTDLSGVTIDVICDVDNPLYGHDGAAYVYAPQKGATAQEVQTLDMGLRRLASLCSADPSTPGSGAAGGLGYGLLLLGARLRRGVDVVLHAAQIERHLEGACAVITGEGKIDRQTLCGKLPFGVMRAAAAKGVPVVALAGLVEDRDLLLSAGFAEVLSINPPDEADVATAMQTDVAMCRLESATRTVVSTML